VADALLDTTFFIDLHRGDPGAVSLWEQISDGSLTAALPAVAAFELWLGNQTTEESEFYEAVFAFLEEASLSPDAAKQAGTWLRQFPAEAAERLIRDALIAASALERGEAIFTRNSRDFGRFPVVVQDY